MTIEEVLRAVTEKVAKRIIRNVSVDSASGCWNYKRGLCGGYGRISFGRKSREYYIHRFMFMLAHGAIPTRMHVDHLCRNRCCCNPTHLRLATPRENHSNSTLTNLTKTHCPQGHEYAIHAFPSHEKHRDGRPRPHRRCRLCDYDRKKKLTVKIKEIKECQSS